MRGGRLSRMLLWIFAACLGPAFLFPGPAWSGLNPHKGVPVRESYSKVPLYFIENRGQLDPEVRFYEKTRGHTTYFTPRGMVFSVPGAREKTEKPCFATLRFLGMREGVQLEAENLQEAKANYFLGQDRARWKTNLPTYGSLVYREAYPGVDIRVYGTNRQLEYDILVKPGADLSVVRLEYAGIEELAVRETGDLEVRLKEGVILTQKKPVVYQVVDGKRVEVPGKFILRPREAAAAVPGNSGVPGETAFGEARPANTGDSGRILGFEVASYDRRRPLIIDPVLVYSTYLGGTGYDGGTSIAVDAQGCSYVTGWTFSDDFPVKNLIQGANSGEYDLFVTKFNAAGTSLIYSTYMGGTGDDLAASIAVDSAGSVYVVGETSSSDYPTQDPYQAAKAGLKDAFLTKLSKSGDALVYSTFLGGNGDDVATAVAVDSGRRAYVAGQTTSTDFPTASPFQGALDGSSDAFVTRFNAAGSALQYSTYLGGEAGERAEGIAVDAFGCAYVTGVTTSPMNFPGVNCICVGESCFKDSCFNNSCEYNESDDSWSCWLFARDAFVTKFNANGTAPLYSTYLGGKYDDVGYGIAVDAYGHAYVTGYTESDNFLTENPVQGANAGGYDAFVAKFSLDGSSLLYSTYLGGSGSDEGFSIAVDPAGGAYVAGYTGSGDFPTVYPLQEKLGGRNDAFVSKLKVIGDALDFSTYLGGEGEDVGYGIAVDTQGYAYVAGYTRSRDFPTATPYREGDTNYASDAFALKLAEYSAGSLKVTLGPKGAVQAGARWRVDDGPWRETGSTVRDLAVGEHRVRFQSVEGWLTPKPRTVTVANGKTTQVTATYAADVPTATVVTITAPKPVASEEKRVKGQFLVTRTGETTAELPVSYKIAGTATPGQDYLELPGTVTIPAGKRSAPIVVNPVNDGTSEKAETVVLTLLPGDYQVGTPKTAKVTIKDND